MTGRFSVDRAIIKSILDWELELRKITRRSVPISYPEWILRRITESPSLLAILANPGEKNSSRIITEP
jgi:hypothetical protein